MSFMPSGISAETKVGFALQGGGTHGAFTWGVLSILLDKGIIPSAITGTSSGAINAVITAYGIKDGDASLAIGMLEDFWGNHIPYAALNSYSRAFNSMSLSAEDQWPNIPSFIVNSGVQMLAMTKMFGFSSGIPQILRDNIADFIPDWNVFRDNNIQLFINAVGKKTDGEMKHIVWENDAICPEAIAASGALSEFGGYRIGDITFYDGAYARNPSLEKIIQSGITDLIVINLSRRPAKIISGTQRDFIDISQPVTGEIYHRLSQLRGVNVHTIDLPIEPHWNSSSQANTDPEFRDLLHRLGREAGERFITEHTHSLGKKSTYPPPIQRRTAA